MGRKWREGRREEWLLATTTITTATTPLARYVDIVAFESRLRCSIIYVFIFKKRLKKIACLSLAC